MARALITAIPVLASLLILLDWVAVHAAPVYSPKQAVTTRHDVVQGRNVVTVRGSTRGGGYRSGGYSRGNSGRFYSKPTPQRRPSSVRSPSVGSSPRVRLAPKFVPRIVPRSIPGTTPRASRSPSRLSLSPNLGRSGSRFTAPRIQTRPGLPKSRPLKNGLPDHRRSGVSERMVRASRLAVMPGVGARFQSGIFKSKLGQRNQSVYKKAVDRTAKPVNQNHPRAGIRVARTNHAKPTSSGEFHLFAVSKRAVAGQFTGRTNRGLYGAAGTQAVLKLPTNPRVAVAISKLSEKIRNLQPTNVFPPNQGFLGKKRLEILRPGTMFDRYGDARGHYASPPGTPIEARALSPTERVMPLKRYVVVKPVKAWTGKARPWFNQSGLGTQYHFRVSLQKLIDKEFIKEVP